MRYRFQTMAATAVMMLAGIAPAQARAIFIPGSYSVGGHARAAGDTGAASGIGWYSYNHPNCGVAGSGTCGSSGNPASYTASGTVDATGRLTAYTADATAVGGIAASSSADLAAGTVKAFGASPTVGFYTLTTADAQWYDILNFNIAGANADTVTTIRFSAIFDGTGFDTGTRDRFNNVPSAFVQGIVTIGENGFSNPFSAFGEVIANASNGFTPTTNLYTRNREGYGSWDPASTINRMVFNGQFDLVGASAQQFISLSLGIECQNGAFCDFGHTGTFRFDALPSNVTFTSASGTFLSAVGPAVVGVPEPASWAMLVMGFGLAGGLMRRQRMAVVSA